VKTTATIHDEIKAMPTTAKLAHVIHRVLEFGMAETVGGKSVDRAEDIAEFIIKKRSLHSSG